MDDEKLFIKVLGITLCPLYLLIALLIFIIVGVDSVYADTGADTMVCNYKGVDYFDSALGNNTYCTNLFTNGDSAVWDGVLGINFITSRINYNLDANYNYTFYVSQYVSWFDYDTDGVAWMNPLSHKITLPNNSNAYTGSAEFVQLQSYTCSAKYCIRIDYKVNINVNVSVSYFDLDTTFKGLYFTGYGDKHIRVASVYTMDEPDYDVQNGINNIINNNNNNTNNIINNNQDNTNNIINNNNQNTQDIINNNQQNTENIINGINDNFNTCKETDLFTNAVLEQKLVIDQDGNYVTPSSGAKSWSIYKKINISSYDKITISGVGKSVDYYLAFYDKNLQLLYTEHVKNGSFIVEDGYHYMAITKYSTDNIILNGVKCGNRLDDTNDKLDQIMGGELEDNSSVDTSGLDDFNTASDSLVNKDSLNNINKINISVDSQTNTFVWDLITRILNTHSLIFGLMITMLSIGIIKLILNR